MKKIVLILLVSALLAAISGCNNSNENKSANGYVSFEYFYRGFTPITEETDVDAFNSVLGIKVILTESDWQDFARRFCPTAGSFSSPDFTKDCLIIDSSMYGSRASENVSCNIKSISDESDALVITYDENASERVYAINMNGVGHWFVNVVKVNKNDLPSNFDIYSNIF